MALYKDQNNQVHDDMGGTATHLLPAGCIAITQEEADALRNPPKTPEQIKAEITLAAQMRLDAFARSKVYNDVDSMSKYKDLTDAEIDTLPPAVRVIVQRYRTECRYVALKVAETWATLEMIEAEILAGTRPMPTSFADVEPELPVLEWPV